MEHFASVGQVGQHLTHSHSDAHLQRLGPNLQHCAHYVLLAAIVTCKNRGFLVAVAPRFAQKGAPGLAVFDYV